MIKTYAYGFPRLGENREYKKTIESFWKKEINEKTLNDSLDVLQKNMIVNYQAFGHQHPSGEITAYDPMLDAAITYGLFKPNNLNEYYDLCRGNNALAMTKWFNTNYHYLVTDFSKIKEPHFELHWNKPKIYWNKHKTGVPYLIGPFTFLKLSRGIAPKKFNTLLLNLSKVVGQIVKNFKEVHIDEPAFVLDLTSEEIQGIKEAYRRIDPSGQKINLFTYYDDVDFLRELYDLPLKGIGLDFVHGRSNLDYLKAHGFPANKSLYAGVVDGRNVWRVNYKQTIDLVRQLESKSKSLFISNAGPLYHLPITLQNEKLPPDLLLTFALQKSRTRPFLPENDRTILSLEEKRPVNRLSFAKERLAELQTLAKFCNENTQKIFETQTKITRNASVVKRLANLKDSDFKKQTSYNKRRTLHQNLLKLPTFPTTTIGSFPQTPEVRKMRSDFRSGKISNQTYTTFIQNQITELIKLQEKMGLDVFVHGEFERTDMVEFFAEKLEGIATTANGWIISYGTRVYRPPIIFSDIYRALAMTLDEITYAQRLTTKPVKGMLTGPVTIIAWSFVREDIPLKEVAYQLALALQDEIRDYERNRIKIVQIDEPALREKAPLKKRQWKEYFDWAIGAFRLASNTDPQTQIHTHMCYSEFGEIIDYINDMDFDVITIETTRSQGEIIRYFENKNFKRQIGLGVWDIHSPSIPTQKDMRKVVDRALKVIPKENFWVNPDCGLKTRGWPETITALETLIDVAKTLRTTQK